MLDVNAVEHDFELLKVKLTPLQRSFLDARRITTKDGEACKAAGVGYNTVGVWKKKSQDFLQAYTLVTKVLPDPRRALILPEGDRQQLVRAQIEYLSKALPQVVVEHVQLALHSTNEMVRIRAIEKLYEVVGLGPEPGNIHRNNRVLAQMLSLIAPQLKKLASSKGMAVSMQDIPSFVEGEIIEEIEVETNEEEVPDEED